MAQTSRVSAERDTSLRYTGAETHGWLTHEGHSVTYRNCKLAEDSNPTQSFNLVIDNFVIKIQKVQFPLVT